MIDLGVGSNNIGVLCLFTHGGVASWSTCHVTIELVSLVTDAIVSSIFFSFVFV
jgi:hypothetical protein